MTTVVQDKYSPQIRAGIPGMISHETSSDVSSWLCGTAAGIGFGLAVSGSSGNPKEAVIGGASFLGVTVIDITLNGLPIDPLSGTELAADLYGEYVNMAVMTRGRCWVEAQADVSAGDALYYEQTGGTFSNSASGTAASGAVTYTAMPQAGDVIVIGGTSVEWMATGASGAQVNIGPTLGASLVALAAYLNGAVDTNIAKWEYEAYPTEPGGVDEGSGANTLLFGAKTVGVAGNGITITTTTAGATVTAPAGGTAAATLITGGRWLDNAVAGTPARISISNQI